MLSNEMTEKSVFNTNTKKRSVKTPLKSYAGD